jgi:hypothetical protein
MSNLLEGEVLRGHLVRLRELASELEIEADLFERQASTAPEDTIPDATPMFEIASVVPAGEARLRVLAALSDVGVAIGRLEALAVGIARQLDATANK